MSKGSKARLVNGVVSALIVVFFLVHGTLGGLSALFGFKGSFSWLVWVGVVLIVFHIVVSVVTSRQQLSDIEHPPSQRKKRHLVLKWTTGCLLAAAAVIHIVVMRLYGADAVQSTMSGALLTAVLAVVLAVHLCVGSRSLLKDLGVDRRYKMAFRIIVIGFAVFFAVAAIAGAIQMPPLGEG